MYKTITQEKCNLFRFAKTQTTTFWRVAALNVLAMMLTAASALATVTITPATGGSTISADNTGGTWTTLTGPVAAEGALGDISAGGNPNKTIVLNAPSGFVFNTGVTVSVIVTGDANANKNINSTANGGSITATVASTTITLTLTSPSGSGGTPNTLTWSNIQVRPTAGTPLASGNIVNSGTSTVNGTTGTTSWGTLTEVVGNPAKVLFVQQPTSQQTGQTISPAVTVKVVDQFTNTVTSSSATVNMAIGSNPSSGTLSGTTGVAASSGIATFSTLSINNVGTGYTLSASSTGLTSATSSSFNITKGSTTMSLGSSSNPSVSGQSVTFTATVSATSPAGGSPTGTVTFKDGATTLGTGSLSGGVATFSTSALSVASHSITAEYAGSSNFNGSTNSPALSQSVIKASTTMAISSSSNPSVFGESVTLTATVSVNSPGSGTPTGSVTFKDGATTLGTGALSGGQATLVTSGLSVNSHSITAEYTGTSSLNGSTNSPAFSQTVGKASTTMAVTSGANPSVSGQSVTFTATVSANSPGNGTATGSVTFKDGATTLGTGTLSGGQATLLTSSLSVASHPITAEYTGDGNFKGSTNSPALSQTVDKGGTTTALSSGTNPSVSGQSVTFTATVSITSPASGTLSGSVTFKDGATTLGTGTLSGNVATLSNSSLSVGSHSITAEFSGDSSFNGSTNSPAVSQTVNKADTTTGVTSDHNPSVSGQSVTFTATVSTTSPGSGTPSGSVTFKDGATTLGSGSLSGGQATFSTSALSVASHSITAVYGGDSSFNTSTSSTLSQTVNNGDTTTSVSPSANPSVVGQSVTFTATVSATSPATGTPTGTVTFKDGATTLGTGSLSSGQATFSTSALSLDSHSITAVYGGDSSFNTSTSSAVSQTVNKSDTSTAVTSSANPSVFHESVTFTATVSATSPGSGTPTGTVTFKADGVTVGTGTLDGSGQATASVSSLNVAGSPHAITAEYGGDSNFNTSTSSTLSQTVNKADTSVSLSPSANPSSYRQSVTFTATISVTSPATGSYSGGGTVTFSDGATTLGTATVSAGQATFSTSDLSVGSHSITAALNGNANFNGSVSSAVSQVVSPVAETVTVSSSVNPSIVNQSVSFSATVPPASGGVYPTGVVQFKIDGSNFGSAVALSSGSAESGGSTSTLSQGDHTVTVEYSGDSNYAATTNSLTQTVTAPLANCTASNNGPVCTGNTLQLFGTTTDTGSGVYYSWTGPNGFTSTNQNPTIANVTAADAGTYWLTTGTTGTTNCIESTVVSVAPTLTASVSADTVCTGSSGNITANPSGGTAPYSYSWSPGGATTQTISANDATVYTVTVTDSTGSGCSVQASGSLTLKPLPVVAISGASTVCPNSTNTFSGPDGMSSYAWSVSGAATIDGAANTQTVSVVAAAGCNTNFSVTLAVVADGCVNGTSTNVSVIDNTAPTITSVPADATVSCANAVPAANDAAVVASDDCSTVTVSHLSDSVSASNCPNNFTITRTYVATDACGNSSSQSQTITVHDTTGPVITGFPADATYACSSAVPSADDGSVTASDACGGSVSVTHADDVVTPGSCANRYSIARTYTVTDACGNSSSQTQTITVNDNVAPVLSGVPADTTVQCNAVPSAATPTASDNCDSNPSISFNETSASGSCANSYVLTRTWTATDSCGNSSSGTQVITVVDTAAPVLANVPADATVQCDNVPSPGSPTASDNCDSNPSISFAQTSAAGSCAGSYVLTRTWTASDVCGNSSSASQTITVIDSTAPAVVGVPADATVQCDAIPTAPTLTATDNCDTNATVTFAQTSAAGTCANSYVLTRTWTATDACGNSSSASQTITVIDSTAPAVVGVPADATVQCDAVPAAPALSATDNCDTNATVSFNETSAAGSCANSYVLTRTWTATDACGNSSSSTQTITVIDTTAPVLAGVPADATVQCDNVPAAATPTATDTCDSNPSISYNQTSAAGSCANSYVLTRVWTATDVCGNSSSATQTITVIDNTAPVLAGVPANTTVQCNAIPTAATPTATDTCDSNPTIGFNESSAAGSCAGSYTLTRVWTATDACGNSSSGTQVITVVDTTAPVLANVPADATVQCDNVPSPGSPTASDNCDSNPSISFAQTSASGSCAGSYVLTRTWTASDVCGNTSSASQTITVIDSTAPSVVGVPADTTVQCDAVPTAPTLTATDNCDTNATVTFAQTSAAGTCANSYVLTRTWTATDACGNSSSSSQTITVIDSTAPVIAGVPADATVQCDNVPAAATPTATDSCDSNPTISYNQTSAAGSCANSYVLTRVWTATDACGNSSSSTQTITVIDNTAPVLAGVPADATVQCNAVPSAATPTATDNCDSNPTIGFNETSTPGACANSYVLTRVWTATDACGNSSSGTQTITVIDSIAPVISGVPADATVQCDAVPTAGSPTATDNCDTNPHMSYAQTSAAGSCAGSYVLTRTWTATDACGNSSSASQTITVIDSTAPAVVGVPADATVQCDAVPTAPTLTATDNCDTNATVTFAETSAPGSCANSYVLTRTWTATDVCGNSSSTSQTITVIDSTAPAVVGVPADTTVQCDAVPPAPMLTATDNCDTNATVTFAQTSTPGTCGNSYVLTRTWTATDACGNTSSSSQTLTVIDTTAPVLAGVPADATVQCDNVPAAATPTATDTCDSNPTISYNQTSAAGSCANSYVLTRIWTATDVCGNSSSGTQTITVIDSTAPVLAGIPGDVTVQCDAVPSAGTPTATDNCDSNPSISFNESITNGVVVGQFTIVRTWTATDACGNSSSASQHITAFDSVAPVLSGVPGDATVECSAVPAAATPSASDNCDPHPTVSLSESTVAGSCANSYVLTRTWTASDASGNSSSATQTITVHDTTAPTVTSVPADTTVQCDAVPTAPTLTATDNCDTNATVTFAQTSAAGTCSNSYVLTRTWTATDACGNSSTSSQTITVIDTTAPVIAGVPANATVQCDAVPTAATPTATDNCDSNPSLTFNESTAAGSCAANYVITRTWTATDTCGNSSVKTQTITVHDTTGPVITGVPADTTVQCNNVPSAATPTATDNCDSNPSISFSETSASGACANSYVLTRTWTATDVCGNSSTSTQHITVVDNVAPVLSGVPANTTAQCDSIPSVGSPTASDNCDANPTVSFSQTTAAGSCAGSYTLTRTWTATDACGNSSSSSQTITVIDNTAPVLSNVPANTTAQCGSVPSASTPTATDNCDTNPTVTLSETTTPGSCAGSYTLTRTWTASDVCGNSSTASQTITVIDSTAPVVVDVPANTTVQCDAVPTAPTLSATDNCDTNATVTFAQTSAPGSCSNSYVLTRTWTATDVCGNSSSSSQTITVIDTTAPTIAGVPADATVQCDSVPAAATPTATDNCDSNPTIGFNEAITAGTSANNYTITRTWTATDACGNTKSGQQVITVVDSTGPVLVGVPANTTTTCGSIPTAATVTATDNCDTNAGVTLSETSTQTGSGCGHANYTITRTWTATDAAGNSSTGAQVITVQSVAPSITGFPADATYSCANAVPAADDNSVTATDACGGVVTITHDADVISNQTCANRYTVTRTYHATSACGDSVAQSQTITVNDTTAPTITGFPADATYTAANQVPSADDNSVTATDNCGAGVIISHSADQTVAGVDSHHFTITRTYSATDACGNATSQTQTFTINSTAAVAVAITNGTDIVTNKNSWTVKGTASGENTISAVRYSLNGGPVADATGTTSWTTPALTLNGGTNTFTVYAVDSENNQSTVATAVLFYATSNKLVVIVQDWPHKGGLGTAYFTSTPENIVNLLKPKKVEVGKSYTVTAHTKTNRRFLGWYDGTNTTANLLEASETYTFVFDPNSKIVARFENPFYYIKGSYSGLFSETTVDPRSAGYVSFNMPARLDGSANKLSGGKLYLNGTKYSFPASAFDTNGHAHLVAGAYTVDLDADLHSTFSGQITGTVSNAAWVANLTANRLIDKTTTPVSFGARFTMTLPPTDNLPNGYGYGAIKRSDSGNIAIAGTLADGIAWSALAGKPAPGGQFPLFSQLYKKSGNPFGVLWGWLQFTGDQQGVTGNVYWFRPGGISLGSVFTCNGGITNTNVAVIASTYTSASTMNWSTNGVVFLYDGVNKGLTNIVNSSLIPVPDTTYPVLASNKLALKIISNTGLVSGHFHQPTDNKLKTTAIKGVLLQNQATAAGVFYRTNAGQFLMNELPH